MRIETKFCLILFKAAIKVVQAHQERSDEASCEQDGGKELSSLESTNNSKE